MGHVERTALLALDVQNGLFARRGSLVHDASGVLERIDGLLRAASAAGYRVVLVQDDAGPGLWQPERPEWELHARLTRPAEAVYLRKRFGDAFRGTDLDDRLRGLGIGHLIIVGAMTDFSVRATLQRALVKGYSVTLVSDAHSTLDAPDGKAEDQIDLLNTEMRAAEDRGLPLRVLRAAEVESMLAGQRRAIAKTRC